MERLFCFDPTLGEEETAERKILYFYPTSTPLTEQARRHGPAPWSRPLARHADATRRR